MASSSFDSKKAKLTFCSSIQVKHEDHSNASNVQNNSQQITDSVTDQRERKTSELQNLFSVFQFNNQTYASRSLQTTNKNNIPISTNSKSILNQCLKLT